jgi:tetratricopeptide repeat protein|nr:MAG TPA: Sel1-like repeat [Caudoviricetes sp.]
MRAILFFMSMFVFLYSQNSDDLYAIEGADYNKSALKKIILDFESNAITKEQAKTEITKGCEKGDYLSCVFYAKHIGHNTEADFGKVEKMMLERAKRDILWFHRIGHIYRKTLLKADTKDLMSDGGRLKFLLEKTKYYSEKSCKMDFVFACFDYRLLKNILALKGIDACLEKGYTKEVINFMEKIYTILDDNSIACPLANGYIDAANKINQYFPSDKQQEKRDYQKKAFELMNKEQNQECSYNILGNIYLLGTGTEINYKQALYWYNKDIQSSGLTRQNSYHSLGWMYLNGKGVRQDIDKAIEYYEAAGFSNSYYALGLIYRGLKNDIKNAKEYFGKACDGGYQPGCDEYKNINMSEKPSTSHSLNLNKFE